MIKIYYNGSMYMDYFHGSQFPVIPIPIDKNSNCKDVFDYLKSEIDNVWDHIEYTLKYEGFVGNLEKEIDEAIKVFKKVFVGIELGTYIDYSFSDLNAYEEPCMAIFTIEIEE